MHFHHEGIVTQHITQYRLLLAQLLCLYGRIVILAAIVTVVRQRGEHVQRQEEHKAKAEDQTPDVVLAYLAPLDVQKGGAQRMLQYLLLSLIDERVQVANLTRMAMLQQLTKVQLQLHLAIDRIL